MTDKLRFISAYQESPDRDLYLTRRTEFVLEETLRKMKSVFVMHLFRVVIVTSICIRDSQLYRISIPQMEHLSREDYSISIRLMAGNISIREIRC